MMSLPLLFVVPQSSILDLPLITLHLFPIEIIIALRDLQCVIYPDETRLSIAFESPNNPSVLLRTGLCHEEIR